MCILKKIEAEKPNIKAKEKSRINTAVPQVKKLISISVNISITDDINGLYQKFNLFSIIFHFLNKFQIFYFLL